MHYTLSVVITQDLAGTLRNQARLAGFLDLRHYVRDMLYKAASMDVPMEAPSQPVRLAPTQLKVMKALRASGKPMSVFDFIRASGTSRQGVHTNVTTLLNNGLVEVTSTHSDGTPGAPRRYFKPTELGLSVLTRHEAQLKAQHDMIQVASTKTALALGAVGESNDVQEMEELRAVRAKHAQRRAEQTSLEEAWAAEDEDRVHATQLLLLKVIFAKSGLDAAKAKAPSLGDYVKKRFMEGTTLWDLQDEATKALEGFGGLEAVTTNMNVAMAAAKAKPVEL